MRLGISRRDQDSGSGPGAAALPALPGYPLQVSTLAVVGTGPKGIAIAAKARALAAAGLPAPRVVLVDRGEVAGNWSGRQGCTSGLLPLGTPPEKDVGYPYAASWGDASADVIAAMAEYSWQRHLIRHGAYGDWIDRVKIRVPLTPTVLQTATAQVGLWPAVRLAALINGRAASHVCPTRQGLAERLTVSLGMSATARPDQSPCR
jgi:hypothetical protein